MKTILFIGISLTALAIFSFEILNRENRKVAYHFEWEGIRKEIRDTIIKIDQYGSYDGSITGFNGGESKQYLRIKWLRSNVKMAEAEHLLKYPSSLIQAIIFDKMLAKRQVMIYGFYDEHRNDSNILYTHSGCVSERQKLSDYLKSRILMDWHFSQEDSIFFKAFDLPFPAF